MQSQDTTHTITMETTSASPSQSTRQRWFETLAPWGQACRAILPAFIGTRLLFILLTYFGGILFTLQNNPSFAMNFKSVLYNWYHWDAQRNITIAAQGYTDPSYTSQFPLYPTLLHLCLSVLRTDPLFTGMLVANIAFFAALTIFYRLQVTEGDEQDERVKSQAQRGVLYLALFPTALFFFAAYNTALILCLTLACIYLLRQRAWWLAGCIGGLAALTDITGIFLFIVFCCELFRQRSTLQIPASSGDRNSVVMTVLGWSPLLAAFCIPLAWGIYAYALYKPFHDPWLFLHPQIASGIAIPNAFVTARQALFSSSLYTYAAAHTLFELLITLGIVVLLVLGCYGKVRMERQQWTFLVFGVLILLWGLLSAHQPGGLSTQYDPWPALQYATLLCFPAFMVLARLGERSRLHTTYIVCSSMLLAFLVFQMFTGLWAR